MYGSALRAGIEGFQDGQDRADRRQAMKYGMERRQELDQQQDADRVRAQRLEDEDRQHNKAMQEKYVRPKLDRELRQGELDDEKQRRMMAFHEAYMSRNPEAAMAVYNDLIPDGYSANIQQVGEDQYEIQHPRGRVVTTWEEMFFGKEDGSGLGLFQMLDPMGTLKEKGETRKAKRDSQTRRGDAEFQHGLNMRAEDRRTANQRELELMRGGETFVGDDGTLQILRPDGRVEPVTRDGAPVTAPKYGMPGATGGGRMGGPGGNPFGNSAYNQKLWSQVQMARASNPEMFEGMPDYAVAAQVEQLAQQGKSRSEMLKTARQMVEASAKEFMSPQEIADRAEALVQAVGRIAGPEPSLGAGGDRNIDDPLGIR